MTSFYNRAFMEMIAKIDKKKIVHTFYITKMQEIPDMLYFSVNRLERIDTDLLVKLSNNFDYLFLHSFVYNLDIIRKHHLSTKLVWIIWGHDLNYFDNISLNNNPLKTIWRLYLKKQEYSVFKKMKAIGYCFPYDRITLKKRAVTKNVRPLQYPAIIGTNIIDLIKETQNNCIKVMIGHSALSSLAHIDIIKKLEHLIDDDIKISLPLGYGVNEYKQSIIDYLKYDYNGRYEFIEKMLTPVEYLEYLNTIDICIINSDTQTAVGNVLVLAYIGKKLYFKKNSPLQKGLRMLGVTTYDIESLPNISKAEFLSSTKNSNIISKQAVEPLINNRIIYQQWEYYLNSLLLCDNKLAHIKG